LRCLEPAPLFQTFLLPAAFKGPESTRLFRLLLTFLAWRCLSSFSFAHSISQVLNSSSGSPIESSIGTSRWFQSKPFSSRSLLTLRFQSLNQGTKADRRLISLIALRSGRFLRSGSGESRYCTTVKNQDFPKDRNLRSEKDSQSRSMMFQFTRAMKRVLDIVPRVNPTKSSFWILGQDQSCAIYRWRPLYGFPCGRP
jgi:hypothetical protein